MTILRTSEHSEDEIITEAIKVLSNGGIIIYPTETTYGMGVDPMNRAAVDKLLDYKEKREGKALSIAVSDINMAEDYVELNNTARNIYDKFLPGPITVISKSKGIVVKEVSSEKDTLGVRIPDYQLIINLIKKYGKAITATSANKSNGKRPYKISDILDTISQRQKDLIDLIIDAGELPHNNPSTVIDTVSGEIETLRIGETRFDLEKYIKSISTEQTIELGEKVGRHLLKRLEKGFDEPTVIAIQGDLGMGKTHFASGVAKGLGINSIIKSPTFILSNEYGFQPSNSTTMQPYNFLTFFHIDTYRMEKEEELIDVGYLDMIKKPNIILIEWANRVIPVLDKYKDKVSFIWLKFEQNNDENTRFIYHNLQEI